MYTRDLALQASCRFVLLEAFILSRERRNTRTEASDNEGLLAGKLKGNFNFLWFVFNLVFFPSDPRLVQRPRLSSEVPMTSC